MVLSPASSTTKTGRHDIAEILLKEAFKHQKSKFILGAVHAMLLVGAYMGPLMSSMGIYSTVYLHDYVPIWYCFALVKFNNAKYVITRLY